MLSRRNLLFVYCALFVAYWVGTSYYFRIVLAVHSVVGFALAFAGLAIASRFLFSRLNEHGTWGFLKGLFVFVGVVFLMAILSGLAVFVLDIGFYDFQGYGAFPEDVLLGIVTERRRFDWVTKSFAIGAMLVDLCETGLMFWLLWRIGSWARMLYKDGAARVKNLRVKTSSP